MIVFAKSLKIGFQGFLEQLCRLIACTYVEAWHAAHRRWAWSEPWKEGRSSEHAYARRWVPLY